MVSFSHGPFGRRLRDGERLPLITGKICQPACKPGSVWLPANRKRSDHSSGMPVARHLTRPTRATGLKTGWQLALPRCPYSVLLPMGFSMPQPLLDARWALTPPFHPCPKRTGSPQAVCFLLHFPLGSRDGPLPSRKLSGIVFPWSPDFPPVRPFSTCTGDRPAGWRIEIDIFIHQGQRSSPPLICQALATISALPDF